MTRTPRERDLADPAADPRPEEVSRHLPLKPLDFEVLLLLGESALHGYGILKGVDERSDGVARLEVGSLYRMIARLERAGLVTSAEPPDDPPDARRGRVYGLTELGAAVARAEAARLERVIELARRSRLLTEGRQS